MVHAQQINPTTVGFIICIYRPGRVTYYTGRCTVEEWNERGFSILANLCTIGLKELDAKGTTTPPARNEAPH